MLQSFRSGASLHKLITDAPLPALFELFEALKLELGVSEASDEPTVRQAIFLELADLPADQARKFDDLASRLLTLAASRGAEILLKVARASLQPADLEELGRQPELARAIFLWRTKPSVFADAESLQHAQYYRDFSPIFTAFDAPVDATFDWSEATEQRLRERIVAELQLEGPVRLSHLEVAEDAEDERNHVIIVRHGGPLASVATHGEDGEKDWYYYRPSTEVTLIYSPSRGIVEVCAKSPSLRRDAAVAFAEVGLGQDLSNKPLSFKLYNMSRFRTSLALPMHQPDGDLRVERVGVVEVEVCLADHRERLSLKVPADRDIEAVIEEFFGNRGFRQHRAVRLSIAIEYWPEKGRKTRTLKIVLSEPNRCNLRGNPDPELRKLGYDLLEAWGVLQALHALGPDDRRRLLPALLALYDLDKSTLSELDLKERGFDVAAFAGHGFVEAVGRLGSVLIDESDGGREVVEVGRGIAGTGTFEDFTGRTASLPKTLVTKYSMNREWVRETVLKELLPSVVSRVIATEVPELVRVGELDLGGEAPVVCYLARGLSQPSTVRHMEDHLRGGSTPGYGLILSAGEAGVGYLGSNVVLQAQSFLRSEIDGPAIDLDQLRMAYLASRQRARNGSVIEFVRSGNGLATLHLPGKEPLTLTGAIQVDMVQKLYDANRSGILLVPTGEMLSAGSCTAPKQAFSNWHELEGVYFGSPRRDSGKSWPD